MSTSRDYGVVTFDCYGTLIDWESGIGAAFEKSIEGAGLSGLQEYRVFELYEVGEKRVEAGANLSALSRCTVISWSPIVVYYLCADRPVSLKSLEDCLTEDCSMA